ncbi:MAG: ELWxxDGT repeat protein [Thermoanaerobaculia bacterium]
MFRRRALAILFVLLGCALSAYGAQPTLLRDVNSAPGTPPSYNPILRGFVSVGSRAVFVLHREEGFDRTNEELWASDGTEAGTERLLALPEDTGVSVLGGNGRIAFFLAAGPYGSDSQRPYALWRTDGTQEGTFIVADPMFVAQGWTFDKGLLVFSGCPTLQDCEPWVSDGTAAGTRRLRDITPGEYGSAPREFVRAGNFVYFFATAPDGNGLWRTDGTPRGTRRVALLPRYSAPQDLVAAGPRLFFRLGPPLITAGENKALWTSDGTAGGTRTVPPFHRPRGKGPAVVRFLGAVGDLEFFLGVDPVLGQEVYRTDGTASGTFRVSSFANPRFYPGPVASLKDRLLFVAPDRSLWAATGEPNSAKQMTGCPGGCPAVFSLLYSPPATIVVKDGLAFFSGASRPPGQDTEPWVSDGTPEGTRRIADLCRGNCSSYPILGPVINGLVLFYADGNLWGTDGSAEGTHLLAVGAWMNVDPYPQPQFPLVAAAGDRLVFAGYDKSSPPGEIRYRLESTEGSIEATRVLDIPLLDGAPSNPRAFTALGDDILFFACSQLGTVWKTRGTPETTIPLTDALVYCDDPAVRFETLNGIAYFKAINLKGGEFWFEVWRTDGTPQGTFQVSHVGNGQSVNLITVYQGKLVFFTQKDNPGEGEIGTQVWTSDGTAAGTVKAGDLPFRAVAQAVVAGGMLLLQAVNADGAGGLYRSDLTEAGTVLLYQLGAPILRILEIGGKAFFFAGGAIFQTDGTPQGTQAFVPAPAGVSLSQILDVAQLGGKLYFMAVELRPDQPDDPGTPALFRSDGTPAGTVLLRRFSRDPAAFDFIPPAFTVAGSKLFFVAADPAHGTEPWRTDGTAAGTVLVRDINPGPPPSRVQGLTAAGGRMFFAADDGEHGVELWTSDGTAGGTVLIADIAAGPPSSFPRQLAVIGNRLYFSSDDGVAGREPWVLPLDSKLLGRISPW